MVGYIADATIESQVRVRFDAGFHNNVPDRSEFFYAQCGCNGAGAPGPGAPGAGDLVTDLNFQQLTVDGQYAANSRVAVFAALPLRFVQPQSFLGETFKPALPNSFENESGLERHPRGCQGGDRVDRRRRADRAGPGLFSDRRRQERDSARTTRVSKRRCCSTRGCRTASRSNRSLATGIRSAAPPSGGRPTRATCCSTALVPASSSSTRAT